MLRRGILEGVRLPPVADPLSMSTFDGVVGFLNPSEVDEPTSSRSSSC